MSTPPPATFSMLVMSIASSAAMSMGLAPHPETGQVEKDKELARFNIDLLAILQTKTKGHLTEEEQGFLDSITADLQLKFVQMT